MDQQEQQAQQHHHHVERQIDPVRPPEDGDGALVAADKQGQQHGHPEQA
jgi:hypothetical protein